MMGSRPHFDAKGWTKSGLHRLHFAAIAGNVQRMERELLKNRVPVDMLSKEPRFQPATALMFACRYKNAAAIKCLLEHKANLHQTSERTGLNPLMTVIQPFHSTPYDTPDSKKRAACCARLLLESKADRSARCAFGHFKGQNALEIAKCLFDRNDEIVTMLEAEPAPEAPPAPFPTLAGLDDISKAQNVLSTARAQMVEASQNELYGSKTNFEIYLDKKAEADAVRSTISTVYGDTDSIMMTLSGSSPPPAALDAPTPSSASASATETKAGPVITLDFAKLYPPMMEPYNLGSTTQVPQNQPHLVPETGRERFAGSDAVTNKAHWFLKPHVRHGLSPQMHNMLSDARKQAETTLVESHA